MMNYQSSKLHVLYDLVQYKVKSITEKIIPNIIKTCGPTAIESQITIADGVL